MRVRSIGRAAAMLFCLAAAGVAALSASAQASAQSVPDATAVQTFAANSGDACLYGQVKGMLGWRLPPLGGGPAAVDVAGTLLDKPTAPVPAPECGDDRRFTTVSISAYARGAQVDTALVRADNGTESFQLQLTSETSAAPIELVVVQVCRQSLATGPFDYCGARQVYRAPVSL